MLQGCFQRLGDAVPVFLLSNHPVHHDFNIMDLVAVQLHLGHYLHYNAVHPDLRKAHFPDLFKQLPIMTLPAFDQRCQNGKFLSGKVMKKLLYNLIFGLSYHFLPAEIRIGLPGSCKQQPHKIVDFRNRAYGRTRVF